MVVMYNPQDAQYADEMSVRHEISRVFDACFSCQKCVESCGVFPRLVSAIEGCRNNDASLLTPEQQDDIVESCHMCMQCVVQCPYSQVATDEELMAEAVRFPELVIRHRTMLWSQGFVGVRQRYVSYLVSYWPYVVHRLSILRRVSLIHRVMRSVLATYVTLPMINGARSMTRRLMTAHRRTRSGDVVFFPTCVVNEFQPQLVDDFLDASGVLRITCSQSSSLVCCGAPSLYAGNIRHFRRVAKKNISRLSRQMGERSAVVVGQPSCLGVMKQFYPAVVPGTKTATVVSSLCDMTEFLVSTISDVLPNDARSDGYSHLVILQSSAHQFADALRGDDDQAVQNFLTHTATRVSVEKYPSFAETLWSSQHRFHNDRVAVADAVQRRLVDLENQGDRPIVLADSSLAAIDLGHRTGGEIVHPVSWLREQLARWRSS